MHIAAIPGTAFAIAASVLIGRIASPGPVSALVAVAIGGAGGLLLYVLTARLLKIDEVGVLTKSLRARFGLG